MKERKTQPNSDPTLKTAMDTKTDQFKQIAQRQKRLNGKALVKNSVLNNADTGQAILSTNGRE